MLIRKIANPLAIQRQLRLFAQRNPAVFYGALGHWYMPYTSEFTDEELGIPSDSAEDPEYWGNHDKPYGTYR
uniref:Uncharacterized protein n=1 Tax=Panagrolaimus sp. ES5 TaxID=591445 RepID=A0AC34G840_9BILA